MSNPIPQKMAAVELLGYGGLDRLRYCNDRFVPACGADDVLVKVGACGMNNTDINLRTQWYDRSGAEALTEKVGQHGTTQAGDAAAAASWNSAPVQFPRIQGAAVAGVIAAIGSGVAGRQIGERVLIDPQIRDLTRPAHAQLVAYLGGDLDGGFAEYVVVPAANAHRHNAPYSDAEMATFPTSYDTAEEMLARARLSGGETVLITGAAGGVGSALIQLAKIRGARVIALASPAKREEILSLGADHFIARDQDDLAASIADLTGGAGVEVVADIIGGPLFGAMIKSLARGGRYATAGALAGPVQPFDLRDLIYKDLEMFGITCPSVATFARILRLIESGALKPLLAKSFALKDLATAQAEFVKRQHIGKFVVLP